MLLNKHKNMIAHIANRPPEQQLNAINMFWNTHVHYVPDTVAWGRKDYWPSAYEVLVREVPAGDCNTFVGGKYESAQTLGLNPYIYCGRILTTNPANGKKEQYSHAWVECQGYVLDCPPNKGLQLRAERNDLATIVWMNDEGIYTQNTNQPVSNFDMWASCIARRGEIV